MHTCSVCDWVRELTFFTESIDFIANYATLSNHLQKQVQYIRYEELYLS